MPDLSSLSSEDQAIAAQFLNRLGQYNDQYTNAQNQEGALGRYFTRVMSGNGPSVAAQQINQTTDQIARQQQAQVAGTSGVNAVAARREAMQNTANATAAASQSAALARTQEEADAARTAAGKAWAVISARTLICLPPTTRSPASTETAPGNFRYTLSYLSK